MSSEAPQKNLKSSSRAAAVQSFGPFELDLPNARLLRDGAPVALTPRAFEALVLLTSCPGQLVTREQFLSALWPDTIVEDGNLTSTIWMVRRALGEHEGWIQTVPKRGYRFVAEIDRAPTGAPVAGARSRRAPRQYGRAAIVIALAAIGIVATSRAWLEFRQVTAAGPMHAIAVLPFRSLSADADQAYFADGMTDAIITELAGIEALRVVPHQSVRRYGASDRPLADIARELKVDAIVEGSVGRMDRRIRLTVQLTDARSEQHLWAATYDRELDDVLALQGELAAAVASAVHVRVSGAERSVLGARRTVDPDAYDAYLRGRYFFAQRSERALARSREHFRRAIERDATFAPAWAGLALAYGPSGFFGYVPPAEGSEQQRGAAKRALQLDPTLVDAEVALANVLTLYDRDWKGAERAYRRILERHPDHAQARLWYGMMLGQLGRLEDALAERLRALAQDPLSLRFNTSVADTLTALHRYDEAIARYRRTLELEQDFAPAQIGLGVALLRSGHHDEAVTTLEDANRVADDARSQATLGHAYGTVGRAAEARAILDALGERARGQYLSPVYLAFVYAGSGDRDAAFAELEKAFEDRSPLLVSANSEPLFDPLRSDPRFADLLRRLQLLGR
jgi:TolB-like protein/DNA-binding winged helix-turn-helix (wHTH) protein/tetratricopeptide (TPR) repeat protein